MNPSFIVRQLDKLRDRARPVGPEVLSEIKGIDRQGAGIDKEQRRLPDAYTEGAISLERLKFQIDKVEAKKQGLETRRVDLLSQLEKDKEVRSQPDSIDQVCGKISKRLKAIQGDFEAKRYLLALLVMRIVLERRKVRIRGIIPAAYPAAKSETCRIASLSSGCCGRNTASFEFELIAHLA